MAVFPMFVGVCWDLQGTGRELMHGGSLLAHHFFFPLNKDAVLFCFVLKSSVVYFLGLSWYDLWICDLLLNCGCVILGPGECGLRSSFHTSRPPCSLESEVCAGLSVFTPRSGCFLGWGRCQEIELLWAEV